MTKDEFIARESAWKSYRTKISFLWFVGLGFFMLWSFFLSGKQDLHGASPLFQACAAVYLFGGIIVIAWLLIRRMRQLGVVCPKCGRPFLFSPVATKKVIATGKCGRCGEVILDENHAA